jgi:hypothetical protein
MVETKDLNEHLVYWLGIANQRRGQYGLPAGLMESLLYGIQQRFDGEWLRSIVAPDPDDVDPFGLTGHPLKTWLRSPFIDQHVIQTMELGAYIKEFDSDPGLIAKIRKMQRDNFWPILFELAMAYRMKQVLKPQGTLALCSEVASDPGDFVLQFPDVAIACECSRLGYPPQEEEPLKVLQAIYAYIGKKIKGTRARYCIKIDFSEPLNGNVYNRSLRILKAVLGHFLSTGKSSVAGDDTIKVLVEPLTKESEQIPFRLIENQVVDVANSSWSSAYSLQLVPARDERELGERRWRGEKIRGHEHARIFVKFPPEVIMADPYERLAARIQKKRAQAAAAKSLMGRIILVEWPMNPRNADTMLMEAKITAILRNSPKTLAIAVSKREWNPHYRHHYSTMLIHDAASVSCLPQILGCFSAYDGIFDPILNEQYPRTWQAARENVAREIRDSENSREEP